MSRRSPVQILGTLALVPLPGCMAGAGVGAGKGGRLMAKRLGRGFPILPTLPATMPPSTTREWEGGEFHRQFLMVGMGGRRAEGASIRSLGTGKRTGEVHHMWGILKVSLGIPKPIWLATSNYTTTGGHMS